MLLKQRRLVVLGFNATLTTKVISWRSVTHMCFLPFSHQYHHNFSFQSHQLLFSYASAEVRGKNKLERKFASTGDQTHNHQVMSLTRSPLSHVCGAKQRRKVNKRAMMALNRSPESVSPQNEFYLLCYYCSNL